MEILLRLLELVYHSGSLVLYGNSRSTITARTVIIGLIVVAIGWLPLSIGVFVLAIYVWLFAMLHPSLREISGLYLGMAIILGIVIGAGIIAK